MKNARHSTQARTNREQPGGPEVVSLTFHEGIIPHDLRPERIRLNADLLIGADVLIENLGTGQLYFLKKTQTRR